MCQSDVYLRETGGERLLMKGAAELSVEGEEVVVRGLLGEEKHVRARVRRVDLMAHKVILEER